MKQNKKFLILTLLLLVLTISLIGCSKNTSGSGGNNSKDFDAFLEKLFTTEVQKDTLTLHYSLANPENFDITDSEVTLGHYSVKSMEDMLVDSENYLASINKFKYNTLSESQKLSYDIVKSDLKLELKSGDFILYNECLGPTTGTQAQLPILLAEYNFYNKKDIDNYIELLPLVYDYFEEIAAFEKEKSAAGLFMSDAVASSILDQCEVFIADKENNYLIEIFNEKIANFKGLTKDEITSYQVANKEAILDYVIPAYKLIISTLTELKGTGTNDGGLCNYDKGKEYYKYLIAVNTGSSKPISELKEMLDTSITTNMLKLSNIMDKDPTVYDTVTSLTYSLTDPTEIVDYLKSAIKKDFPTCPSVNCSIKYVPESLKDHLSPAMYLIPAIDSYKDNTIYINNNSDYDLSQIFTTIAHEGYPGHLYQSVYFRAMQPANIRSLLSFGGYVEGWATYVEYYSYHLASFTENVANFMEANMAANMALYCRLDMGIHFDGWSLSDTASYLKGYGITDDKTVRLLYSTMIEEPALYPQYGIGYLEIMELKKTAQDALGDSFVLKDFHTFLLDIGPAQFDIIADRLNIWIQKKQSH